MKLGIVAAVIQAQGEGFEDAWTDERYTRNVRTSNALRANECLALCSGSAARNDFYAMLSPMRRKLDKRIV
jgi:hypothetical protein